MGKRLLYMKLFVLLKRFVNVIDSSLQSCLNLFDCATISKNYEHSLPIYARLWFFNNLYTCTTIIAHYRHYKICKKWDTKNNETKIKSDIFKNIYYLIMIKKSSCSPVDCLVHSIGCMHITLKKNSFLTICHLIIIGL